MPLPNLIIAGTNKAGTTSLWSYLAQHPDVGASDVKETCYWLPLRYNGESLPPLTTYERHFAQWESRKPNATTPSVIMESTPGYFYGGEPLAQAIDESCPNVRLVIVLREPVARLVSFFRFKQSQLELPGAMSLSEYVERCRTLTPEALRQRANNPYFGLEGGRYAAYLPAWLERFADDRLRVIAFDDLKADPIGVVTGLCDWLSLDPEAARQTDTSPTNATAGFKHAGLQRLALAANQRGERFFRRHPKIKTNLRTFYRRFNGAPASHVSDDAEAVTRAELTDWYREQNSAVIEQLDRYPRAWLKLNGTPEAPSPYPAWLGAIDQS